MFLKMFHQSMPHRKVLKLWTHKKILLEKSLKKKKIQYRICLWLYSMVWWELSLTVKLLTESTKITLIQITRCFICDQDYQSQLVNLQKFLKLQLFFNTNQIDGWKLLKRLWRMFLMIESTWKLHGNRTTFLTLRTFFKTMKSMSHVWCLWRLVCLVVRL